MASSVAFCLSRGGLHSLCGALVVGADDGVGVDVEGEIEPVSIVKNELRETRQPSKRTGTRLGARTRDIRVSDNHIEGFAVRLADLRQP